ncbi:hypothetical protein ATJ78_0669 [Paramicrobacterium agarici]|uniref:Uncharacterized protein n=1 Tax=Paramicrobacterium agarici TaxID=630514 RepID=A0A2A9DT38_9MICO|nr:hypothetical protein ATJ78_0669 [Microbacterium agarici]
MGKIGTRLRRYGSLVHYDLAQRRQVALGSGAKRGP